MLLLLWLRNGWFGSWNGCISKELIGNFGENGGIVGLKVLEDVKGHFSNRGIPGHGVLLVGAVIGSLGASGQNRQEHLQGSFQVGLHDTLFEKSISHERQCSFRQSRMFGRHALGDRVENADKGCLVHRVALWLLLVYQHAQKGIDLVQQEDLFGGIPPHGPNGFRRQQQSLTNGSNPGGLLLEAKGHALHQWFVIQFQQTGLIPPKHHGVGLMQWQQLVKEQVFQNGSTVSFVCLLLFEAQQNSIQDSQTHVQSGGRGVFSPQAGIVSPTGRRVGTTKLHPEAAQSSPGQGSQRRRAHAVPISQNKFQSFQVGIVVSGEFLGELLRQLVVLEPFGGIRQSGAGAAGQDVFVFWGWSSPKIASLKGLIEEQQLGLKGGEQRHVHDQGLHQGLGSVLRVVVVVLEEQIMRNGFARTCRGLLDVVFHPLSNPSSHPKGGNAIQREILGNVLFLGHALLLQSVQFLNKNVAVGQQAVAGIPRLLQHARYQGVRMGRKGNAILGGRGSGMLLEAQPYIHAVE